MQKLALLSLLKLVASKVPTVNVSDCSLLFKYQGVYYSGCTNADSERMPWCLLKKPINGKVWAFCNMKSIGAYFADEQGSRRTCELSTPVKGTASVFGCYTLEPRKPYACLSGGKELPCIMEGRSSKPLRDKAMQANATSKGAPDSAEDNTKSFQLIVVLSIVGGLALAFGATMFFLYKSRSAKSEYHPANAKQKGESAFSTLANARYTTHVPAQTEHTVTTTYIPTLSDELLVHPGDKVVIFKEYDDGWVQGANLTRNTTKGVFPKYCVIPLDHSSDSGLVSKRSSSHASSKA